MYSKIAICSLISLLYVSSKATAQPPEYPPSGLRPFGEFRSPEESNVRQAKYTPLENPRGNEPVGSALSPPEQLNVPVFDPVEQKESVWFQPLWEGTIEIGMNGSNGNADAFSMKVGASLKRETEHFSWKFDFVHARATARGIATQNNVLTSLRAERKLGNPDWSLFGKGGLEYDEFKAFDYRIVVNGGLAHKFINLDFLKAGIRFGSGVSREFGGPDDRYVPEAVFGFDYEHQFTERQKLVATIDYLPEWSDFGNYRIVTDVGWEILLDAANNLSLKIGLIDRYDSTPHGLRPNDLDYSLLLIWKL